MTTSPIPDKDLAERLYPHLREMLLMELLIAVVRAKAPQVTPKPTKQPPKPLCDCPDCKLDAFDF